MPVRAPGLSELGTGQRMARAEAGLAEPGGGLRGLSEGWRNRIGPEPTGVNEAVPRLVTEVTEVQRSYVLVLYDQKTSYRI